MEPQIQYATAQDGARIAYATAGEGAATILMIDPGVSHAQLIWSQPLGQIPQRLALHNRLIWVDSRGSGLSDRSFGGDLDEFVGDLEAVVDRLELDSFSLTAVQAASPIGVAFAAKQQERLTRLVLVDGFLRTSEFLDTPPVQAIVNALQADYELGTEIFGAAAFGSGSEANYRWGEYVRACAGPDFWNRIDIFRKWDATAAARTLRVPTLILKHEGVKYVTDDMTRDLASTIRDSRLVVVPGMWAQDPVGLAERISAFVNDAPAPPRPAPPRAPAGVQAILFTDIERNTQILARLGDARWRALLREHEQITRDLLEQHTGNEIKTMGDAFMASFSSPVDAVNCAIALQRAFAARNASSPEPILLRTGINAGEPIAERGDLFGASVTMASRIAGKADGGEILVSNVVRELAAGKGFLFSDRGDVVLRGFEDPVRLYEVRWKRD